MHGQGNDFVVLGFETAPGPEVDFAARARKMCRRSMGAGADGLVAVLPSGSADFRMRIFNPDGTEPEMCGNGVRCAAKYYIERMMDAPGGKGGSVAVTVETLAGVLRIDARLDDAGAVGPISVDMGAPILDPARIPVEHTGERAVRIPVNAAGRDLEVTCVSMGNPHAVIFIDEQIPDEDFFAIGPAVENHPMFPNKTNVEFVRIINGGEVDMRVWERGVGETLACGTGACATAVAANLNGLCGRDVTVHLRGGDLQINWTDSDNVIMSGTAVTVYEGEYLDL